MSQPIPPDDPPRLTVAERRARLQTLVRPDETVTARRRKELGELLGVSPATIYRDLQALRAAAQPPRRVDIPLYVPAPQIADRDLVLLRVLGHTHVLRANWIRDLLYPDRAQRTVNHRLEQLRSQGLLWCSRQRLAPQRQQTTENGRLAPPPNQPALYGLTPAGLERLRETKTLPNAQLFTMHTRAARSAPPSPQRLAQDLRVVSWCASILSAAAQCVRLDGAFAQVGAVISRSYTGDKVDLAADALIALRVHQRAVRRPGEPLPWIDDPNTDLGYQGMKSRLFALHIDTDLDDKTLRELARRYYALYKSSMNRRYYQQIRPIPLILTTSAERAQHIAYLWNRPWEDKQQHLLDEHHRIVENTALITTYAHVTNPQWGALWGTFWRMREPGMIQKGPGQYMLDGVMTRQEWANSCPTLPTGARA